MFDVFCRFAVVLITILGHGNLSWAGGVQQQDKSTTYKLVLKATYSGGKSITSELQVSVIVRSEWNLPNSTITVCMKGAKPDDELLVLDVTGGDMPIEYLIFSIKVHNDGVNDDVFSFDKNVLLMTSQLIALAKDTEAIINATLSFVDSQLVSTNVTFILENDLTPDDAPQFVKTEYGPFTAVAGKEDNVERVDIRVETAKVDESYVGNIIQPLPTVDYKTILVDGFDIIFGCKSSTSSVNVALNESEHDGEFQLIGNKLLYGNQELNYTTKSKYNLKVTIELEEGMNAGANQTATVIVDVNTVPVVMNHKPNMNISVREDAKAGDEVFTFQTIDEDGDDTKLSVKNPDADKDLFILAGKSLLVSNNIKEGDKLNADNITEPKKFPIELCVSDNKNNYSIKFYIVVEDVNDNPPIFTEASPLKTKVVEDANPGTNVTCWAAEDADFSSPNNRIEYSIAEESNMFELAADGKCLIVSNSSRVNFSTTPLILEVVAKDGGPNNTVHSATLRLEITTVARPEFIRPDPANQSVVNILESVQINREVFVLEAKDKDTDVELLTFEIVPSAFYEMFFLEGNVVKNRKPLDAEERETFVLYFQVSDSEYEALSEPLTINITDANDNGPLFPESSYEIKIDENHIIGAEITCSDEAFPACNIDPDGTPVIRINAIDYDKTSPFNELTYAIKRPTDGNGVFEIDENTGDLVLVKTPMKYSYLYVVSASDGGDPPYETSVEVLIVVNPDAVNECSPELCENGASCFPSFNYYKCICGIGWAGQNCEINIDDCSDEYCKNNGTCVDEVNSYSCKCAVGWQGDNCEENIDDCKEDSCQNGGTCIDEINSFTCNCPPEWTGQLCEEDVDCETFPCLNGATCVPMTDISAYFCTCTEGWTGRQCQTSIDDCSEDPCKNGGTCIDEHNGFACNCSAGWDGDTCENGCTGNTYGRNCEETCECTLTDHLSDPNDDQICDIRTGACKCNRKWTGAICDNDVDECEQDDICNSANNLVCENSVGAYECVCKVGYMPSGSSKCIQEKSKERISPLAREFLAVFKFMINHPCPTNLERPSVYEAFKAALTRLLRNQFPAAREVMISNIRCGSIVFDMEVAVHESNKGALAIQIQSLLEGQPLVLDGENVTVSAITIENNAMVPRSEISPASQICKVYTSISPCESDQECRQDGGGAPVCKDIKDGELTIILGLSLGLGLPILIAIILLACFFLYQIHQEAKKKERDQLESSDVMPSYRHKPDRTPRSWVIPRLTTSYDKGGFSIYGERSLDYNDDQHYYNNNDAGLRRTNVDY